MRFIIANDIHIKGINPIHRTDNYKEAIFKKLTEIISISEKYKANGVLIGGDIFDIPIISTLLLDKFMDMIEDSGIPWLFVPGNHDEKGNNWDASESSSLYHAIRRSEFFEELTFLSDKNSIISGFKYYHGIEKDIETKGLYTSIEKDMKIAIVHGLITRKPLPFEGCMHVPIEKIKTNYDVVIVAHNHIQDTVHICDNTAYIFNGCIGRRKINEGKVIPKILYLDTEKQEMFPIELKSASKGCNIFDYDAIEEVKEFNKEIDTFIKSLDTSKIEGVDLRGIIEKVCEDNNYAREVKHYLLQKIGEYEYAE